MRRSTRVTGGPAGTTMPTGAARAVDDKSAPASAPATIHPLHRLVRMRPLGASEVPRPARRVLWRKLMKTMREDKSLETARRALIDKRNRLIHRHADHVAAEDELLTERETDLPDTAAERTAAAVVESLDDA